MTDEQISAAVTNGEMSGETAFKQRQRFRDQANLLRSARNYAIGAVIGALLVAFWYLVGR